MKKKANKILIAIAAIVLVCIVVEVPFIAKTQDALKQKMEQFEKERNEKQQ
jgi:ABC-type sulfate transport system permease subunit